jgi:putative membrane protein
MKHILWLAWLPLFIACANNEQRDDIESAERIEGNENNPPANQLIPGQDIQDSNTVTGAGSASYVQLDKQDSSFVVSAVSGGIMEVQLGELARQKAGNQAVKDFGNQMVEDHSKANSELSQLLRGKGFRITDSLQEKHQKHISMLREKTGAAFDKAYVDHMVKDHEEDVKAFEKASKEAKDADIKAFATKTLPVLKMHLENIKRVQKDVK